ncbi:hypothetical protein [Roseibacillus persicicus]|uniref:Uncharacterized protein n=1 Tax=Roseibacillus persicicus TaxID=454148 RepID=A0A918WG61_9BACT|nr:hypothetical protein [Roseibacillus persicicus]MDQ8189138.1 hypothetical protein [Roseibacillus persicicus]GHC43568.1 hypothetical protein GCM10007100_05910 [Roseibacillus persicicus]
MAKFIFSLFLLLVACAGAYEIPQGVMSISELEKAQQKAKESNKPVVLVVAIKTQPET